MWSRPQSALFYDSGLSPDRLGPLLTAGTDAILTADGTTSLSDKD